MQVAELKQIGISTARSWRDGGNEKWFKALEEVEIENERRKKKGLPMLGSLY